MLHISKLYTGNCCSKLHTFLYS